MPRCQQLFAGKPHIIATTSKGGGALWIILLLVIIIFCLTSCSPTPLSKQEQEFADTIPLPYQELNDDFRIRMPQGLNNFRIGYSISLELINESRHPILFPPDFGIILLAWDSDGEKWVEIENIGVYLPEGEHRLNPIENRELGGPVMSVTPNIEEFSKPIQIRVFMMGDFVQDGTSTNDKVGAYIDITLSP